MEAKTTEWRPGPTVCRCCLAEGCYKDISTEYFWMGKREVYAEMLSETFDVTIAYSQSGGPNSNSRLICEPCISRLRDASEFKRQVLECEKTFIHHLDPGTSHNVEIELDSMEKDVKLERVKLEKSGSDEDDAFDDRGGFADDDDDEDDLDNQPLTKLASKIPKKESVDLMDLLDNAKAAEKRKSTTKVKASPAKKLKTKKEAATAKPAAKVAKVDKRKKKEAVSRYVWAKRNAEVVLQYTTAYPFRLRGKVLFCVYCCEEYDDPVDYRQHMEEQHQTFSVLTAFAHTASPKDFLKVDCTDFKCRVCDEPLDSLEDAMKHIYYNHEAKNLYLKYEVGMQPYKMENNKWICVLCNAKLPSLTNLCRHMSSHYRKYTCDVCGRSYLTIESLKYHARVSHADGHVCRKCWTKFPTPEKRREHLKDSKSCWSFCCIHCGERFMSWELKQKHMISIHDVPKKLYNCPECEQQFEVRKAFYNHYKLNHTEQNFVCSCCGLKFESKYKLEDHRLVHTGEKHFKCSVCFKRFSRDKSLKQHMWIHSETKRFACVECGKQFVQKVSLKGHLKTYHPELLHELQ